MYFLDGMLFPFEIFAENFNKEDKIYQIFYRCIKTLRLYFVLRKLRCVVKLPDNQQVETYL
jgi:hypothetical protein